MGNETNAKTGASKDVATIITGRIIEQLEKGTVPWRQPWTDAGIPRNLFSNKPYRGINIMLLSMLGYEQNSFLTEKQLKEINGSIKPQERPHMIVYWNFKDKKEESENAEVEETETKKPPILRYYSVFNVAQCAGIDHLLPDAITRNTQPIPACEKIIAGMPNPPAIKHKEAKAWYSPMLDLVNMPKQNTFVNDESYYSVLFHEVLHSTGHHSRLDRQGLIQMSEFSGEKHAYSFEELIAEIGACNLLCHAGVEIPALLEQSAAYIAGWLQVLKNDKRFIISAATSAQKAVDYILDFKEAKEEVQGGE